MIGYNPSHLNTNETLLEAFHRVEEYLKANPQYQVYQSYAPYQDGKQEYSLDTIVVPKGSTVGEGDVVLFSNVYYAVITAVSETTFSIETATSFRGLQGEQGPQGPKGDTGATGATGQQGAKGESGNATYFYNGTLGESTINAQVSDITIPFGRTLQVDDILISSNASTLGAMAQVAGIVDGVATVDFIGKISTGGGGTTLNRYELSINVVDLRLSALLLYKIYTQAKGRVSMCSYSYMNNTDFQYMEYTPCYIDASGGRFFRIMGSNGGIYISAYSNSYGTAKRDYANIDIKSKTIDSASTENWDGTVKVIYYNDTEIK